MTHLGIWVWARHVGFLFFRFDRQRIKNLCRGEKKKKDTQTDIKLAVNQVSTGFVPLATVCTCLASCLFSFTSFERSSRTAWSSIRSLSPCQIISHRSYFYESFIFVPSVFLNAVPRSVFCGRSCQKFAFYYQKIATPFADGLRKRKRTHKKAAKLKCPKWHGSVINKVTKNIILRWKGFFANGA